MLAGPYPRDLDALLIAGVDLFVDLTEEAEALPAYWNRVEHRRFPVPDFTAPSAEILDAVLATPTIGYLATADEKTQRLSIEPHLFKDKHPVGVDPDGRFVLVYVATEACSHRFIAFLQRAVGGPQYPHLGELWSVAENRLREREPALLHQH